MSLKRIIVEIYLRFKHGSKLKKPLFLLRLIKNYSVIFLGRQPLKYVEFVIDYTCNLKCQHCFAKAFKKSSDLKKMGIDDYKRVANEAMKLGALDFSFQGGEPFLFFELLTEIIKACQPKKNLIAITTNATLIDKERIIKLKRLGVDHLTISLDSGIAEEHDKFRGVKGTFAKAAEVIKLAKNYGMNIIINTTISHFNLYSEGFHKLIEFSSRNKILLNTILAVSVGRWQGKENFLLTQDDLKYLEQLRKKYPFIRRDVDSNYLKWGCGAVKESLYITPHGDVLACPFIHISLGNIFEEPLAKIRERGLSFKFFNHYHQKCLAGEDRVFIKKYLSRTFNQKNLPISFKKGFKD